jgi:hypothetical protein
MRTSSNELWAAGIAVTAITLAYVFMLYHLEAVPPASGFIGHSIGVLGFALMVMTETVYPLRKRRNAARWGRMSSWLDFHIFTGIVGPYMVLLHSAWEFHGRRGERICGPLLLHIHPAHD